MQVTSILIYDYVENKFLYLREQLSNGFLICYILIYIGPREFYPNLKTFLLGRELFESHRIEDLV